MPAYRAEFVAPDPSAGALLAMRAGTSDVIGVTRSDPTTDGGTRVSIMFEAPDNYSARTLALAVQGSAPTEARIQRHSAMFPGPWFDLNEEG